MGCRVLFDVGTCLLIAGVSVLLGFNIANLEPFHRGFFCHDDSIRYPYTPDTVSDTIAITTAAVLPALCMVVLEAFTFWGNGCRYPELASRKAVVQSYIVSCYKTIGVFIFGGSMNMLVTEVTKLLVGRLRPHFLDVCQPDYSAFNCSDGYIIGDYCRGTDAKRLMDARKSFPSGHTSGIVYGMLYLMVYLHIRFTWRKCHLLRPILQMIAFGVALYISCSRISDYKHHWSDVVGGALLGLAACVLTVHYVSYLYTEEPGYDLPLLQNKLSKPRAVEGKDLHFLPHSRLSNQVSIDIPDSK